MQQSFAEFLKERQVDTDTIQQAARYYIAERTNDLPSEEMRGQIVEAVGDAAQVDSALDTLQADPLLVTNAALALLSQVWEVPGEAEKIRSAVDAAKAKLPVIESALIAIVGMYSLYLIATGGVKKTETTVQKNPDGSVTEKSA